MATRKAADKGPEKNEEKVTNHGLDVTPTMPYYCTWLPGACPVGAEDAKAQTLPPLTRPPMCPPEGAGAATIIPTIVPPCPTMPQVCVPTINPACPKPEGEEGANAQIQTIILCTGVPVVCPPQHGAQAQTVVPTLSLTPPICGGITAPNATCIPPTTIANAQAGAQTVGPVSLPTVCPTVDPNCHIYSAATCPVTVCCPPQGGAQAQTLSVPPFCPTVPPMCPITVTTTVQPTGGAQAQAGIPTLSLPTMCPTIGIMCPITVTTTVQPTGGAQAQAGIPTISLPTVCPTLPPACPITVTTTVQPTGGAQAQTLSVPPFCPTVPPLCPNAVTTTVQTRGGAQAQTVSFATVCPTVPPLCPNTVTTTVQTRGGAQAQTVSFATVCPTVPPLCPNAVTTTVQPTGGAQAQTVSFATICPTVPPLCPKTVTTTVQPTGGAQAQGITGVICSIVPTACIVTAVAHCGAAAQAQGQPQSLATVCPTTPPNCIVTAATCPVTACCPPQGGAQAQAFSGPACVNTMNCSIPCSLITCAAQAQASPMPTTTATFLPICNTVTTTVQPTGGAQLQTNTAPSICPCPTTYTQINCPTKGLGCPVTVTCPPHGGGAQAQTTILTTTVVPTVGITIGTVTLAGHCPGAAAQTGPIVTLGPATSPCVCPPSIGCPPQGGAQAQTTILTTTTVPLTGTIIGTVTLAGHCPGAAAQAQTTGITLATVCTMPVVCKQDNTIATVCTQVGCAEGGAQAQTVVTAPPICFATTITQPFGACPPQGGDAQAQTLTLTVATVCTSPIICKQNNTLPTVCTQIGCAQGGAQAQTVVTVPPICFPTTITQPLGACPPQGGAAQAQGITGAICSIIPTACIVTAVAHC